MRLLEKRFSICYCDCSDQFIGDPQNGRLSRRKDTPGPNHPRHRLGTVLVTPDSPIVKPRAT
jgi:hypothetical protein